MLITTVLFVVTKKKLLLEAINHIKNISKKKSTTKGLLNCINKSQATNFDEAAEEDTTCILLIKNLIVENLKLLSGHNELVADDISKTPFPGRPSTPTNKIKQANKYK